MKYCTKCGAELHDESVICIKCGCTVSSWASHYNVSDETPSRSGAAKTVTKIFMILSIIAFIVYSIIVFVAVGTIEYAAEISLPELEQALQEAIQANPEYAEYLEGIEIADLIALICKAMTIYGFMCLVPLLWCVPMTIVACKSMNQGKKLGVGFKVCTLLFVSLVSGIVMLCNENI